MDSGKHPPRRARVGKALRPLAWHRGPPPSQTSFAPGRSRSQGLLRAGAREPGSRSWPWSGASTRDPKATLQQSFSLLQLSKANAVCTLSPALGGGLMPTRCPCEQPAPPPTPWRPLTQDLGPQVAEGWARPGPGAGKEPPWFKRERIRGPSSHQPTPQSVRPCPPA